MRQLARAEAYQAVWLAPSGSADSVSFMSRFVESARRIAGLGLAYDNELGGRMWVGAVDRRFLDLALEASTALYLGEFRKELYLGFRRNFQFGRQLMNPALSARLASESVRRFDMRMAMSSTLIETREALGFLGIERAFDPDWQVALGGVGHAWHQPGQGPLDSRRHREGGEDQPLERTTPPGG